MMKKMLAAWLCVVSMLMAFNAMARVSAPVESPQHADFLSASHAPAADKVRQAIIDAGARRGWHVDAEQPGRLTLRNVIRNKHTVVVDVAYDSKGVSVTYVSSENLNYEMRDGVAYIHPKYNEWVQKLLKDIVAKVAF
jgi:hypothetical protein